MKMKYLMLGASRVGLRLLLVQSLLGASTVWARPQILDGAVLGRWTFNDGASSADVSGWGGSSFTINSGTMSFKDSGGFDDSGYLDITASGTAKATLGGGNTLSDTSYQTVLVRYKSNCSISAWLSGNEKEFVSKLNDNDNWHFCALRYQGNKAAAGTYGNTTWRSAIDPTDESWWSSSPRADAGNDSKILIPASVSGSTVTLGGSIGVGSKTTNYKGAVDEVVVVGRLMGLVEMSRYYQTGETFVYPTATPSFAGATGWSSVENNWKPKPGDMPGAAYVIDGGKTLSQGATATFGGDVSKRISLTLGRLAPLVNHLNSQTLVSDTTGNFSQGAGSAITFYDLRLNDGTYAAGGTSLTTTLLDVDAPASKPFALAAAGDFALNVGEDTTGSGVLAMTGAGRLTVSKWTGTAKLRLAAGSIKTPRLDGYTKGTLLIDADSVVGGTPSVTFTGTDTLSGTIQVQYNGTIAAAEATYPVLNAPTLTSDSQVAITAAIPEKYEGAPKLENGVVSLVVTKKVAPIPDEDKGAKPVLLWQ